VYGAGLAFEAQEAHRVRGYGCTSNAPTSHKQNGDPPSDPQAARLMIQHKSKGRLISIG
jgi:hypothetical protein